MTFKEFDAWCNERACDGCWGILTAMVCIDLIEQMKSVPILQREKVWKEKYEKQVLEEIINPIEEKMEEMGVCKTNQKKTLHSTENGQNTEKKYAYWKARIISFPCRLLVCRKKRKKFRKK